jgi:hypothetical protein
MHDHGRLFSSGSLSIWIKYEQTTHKLIHCMSNISRDVFLLKKPCGNAPTHRPGLAKLTISL